jgi:hypothetical protein
MAAHAGPRKAAKEAGMTRYFTGNPCSRGHIAERFVSTKACVVCASKHNVDWYASHPGKRSEVQRNWHQNNREKSLERGRVYRQQYYAQNQAKVFSLNKRRKADIKQRTPAWADLQAIDAIYEEAKRRRLAGEDVVVDHIIPLRGRNVCGLHVHTNLQIICRIANARKSNKLLERTL